MVETINKLIEKFESAIDYQDRRCEYLDGVLARYKNQIYPDEQLEVKQEDYGDNSEDAEMYDATKIEADEQLEVMQENYDDNSEDAETYDATKIEEVESYLEELKTELLVSLRRNNIKEMKIIKYRQMFRRGITAEYLRKPIIDLTGESGQTSDNLPQQQMKNLSISN